MKKNLFARLSCGALALAMLLSGCGKTETGSDGGSNSASSGGTESQNVAAIEMPTADLSGNSKVLKVFGWSSMSENNTDGEAA